MGHIQDEIAGHFFQVLPDDISIGRDFIDRENNRLINIAAAICGSQPPRRAVINKRHDTHIFSQLCDFLAMKSLQEAQNLHQKMKNGGCLPPEIDSWAVLSMYLERSYANIQNLVNLSSHTHACDSEEPTWDIDFEELPEIELFEHPFTGATIVKRTFVAGALESCLFHAAQEVENTYQTHDQSWGKRLRAKLDFLRQSAKKTVLAIAGGKPADDPAP